MCQTFPLPSQHVLEEVWALAMRDTVVEPLLLGPSLHLPLRVPSLTLGPESPQQGLQAELEPAANRLEEGDQEK